MFTEQILRHGRIEQDNGALPFFILFENFKKMSVKSLGFFNLGCGGVLLTAPQMKFIGIPTSPSLSKPLHHIICDKRSRSPEQIIRLPEMSYVPFACICIEAQVDEIPLLKQVRQSCLLSK